MKNMKKTLSLILAVIMLLSAVPMQSFALFDSLWPKVVDVEILDNTPISNKYVQSLASEKNMKNEVKYDLSSDYRVFLSNGRVIDVNADSDGSDLKSGVLYTFVSVYVNAEECAKAIELGKKKVNITIWVKLYNLDDTFRSYMYYTEKDIVEELVTDIKLYDSMPKIYDYLNPLPDFVGKEFKVEYCNGGYDILALEKCGDDYYLGDKKVNMWCEDGWYDSCSSGSDFGCGIVYYTALYVSYIDKSCVLDDKHNLWIFDSIDILDYKLNGKGGITAITYKLVGYEDTTIKTCVLEEPIKFEEYTIIDNINGLDIVANVRRQGDSSYYLACSSGYSQWNLYDATEFDDITEFCDCRCHKDGKLNNLIYAFLLRIWKIFGKNEICQCGLDH